MERLRDDVVYAWRRLKATPGFTLVAVLTLAFGIGANTALFSLVNGVLFKSIPVPNLDRLATLTHVERSSGRLIGGPSDDEFRAIESSHLTAFETFFTSDPLVGALTAQGQAEVITGELVSGNYFEVLGLVPRAGRLLQPADDRESGSETPIVNQRAAVANLVRGRSGRHRHRREDGRLPARDRRRGAGGIPRDVAADDPDG